MRADMHRLKTKNVSSSIVSAIVFTIGAGLFDQAHACSNRPGTPANVKAEALSPSSIRISWRNTTSYGEIQRGSFYDIEVIDKSGRDKELSLTGTGNGILVSGRTFNKLAFNTEYCFRIRARTEAGTQGCVSQRWSAQVCAKTPNPPIASPGSRPSYSPSPCKTGNQPRRATAGDAVCVERLSARLAQDENRSSGQRKVPGSQNCRPGFVWREATVGDTVCVTPARRAAVKQENATAASRTR